MSQPLGPNQGKSLTPDVETDECVLLDLLGWGKLLSSLVQVLDPFYQLEDLLQTEHPLADSEKPLGAIVRHFGKGSVGAPFLSWWVGNDDSFPEVGSKSQIAPLLPLSLARRWRASELQSSALRGFEKFDQEWSIGVDRLSASRNGGEALFSKPLPDFEWAQVTRRLCDRAPATRSENTPRLSEAIDRVRSYFAPLESPLFGMDNELLKHHVLETIPREGPPEVLTPIVPLFGKGHLQKAFPSTAQLPAHLRVILHRLVRSQHSGDLVTSLLATLEAVDFSIRFATGVGQGALALVQTSDFAGDFNPTTQQIIRDLEEVLKALPAHWEDPRCYAATHLLFQGSQVHPFLKWGGVGTDQRLLGWMKEAEETIRQDNPARAAALLAEVMELFNSWVAELTLLCSSWDLVTHVRQDGYLQISLGRGPVWFSCKPLIDPTRYSVWLDRSELTLVNKGGSLRDLKDGLEPVESLDPRISVHPEDPFYLKEQLTALVRAHGQGQILPLGRALFFGLEYLVRLHASLAGGFLRHCFDETSLLDPVSEPGGSLEHIIFFLSYSQRLLGRTRSTDAELLRDVFFHRDKPRDFTVWLGVDGGIPGPLQGLLGWSLSLMRPDAKTRLDEVRGQVERLSGLFADFLEQSRNLFKTANLQTDATGEGTEAVVMRFPSGLRIRGVPEVVNGPRMEPGRRNVVVVRDDEEREQFSDWEGEEYGFSTLEPVESQETEEPIWPSFFEESDSDVEPWDSKKSDAISRVCQSRSFSGPDARPRQIAEEIAAVVLRGSPDAASVLFCQGDPGTGKTNLCRTLANPACTPLPDDYPVLYLRVDRFPRTRLATVVERLNDHIASEKNLQRFEWTSVPVQSLKALGGEVTRISSELAELGVTSEALANRLASYLRHLKKLNEDRNFLLILDGFEEVPASIIPSSLPPGVHVLITGCSFPEIEWPAHSYLEFRKWEMHSTAGEATFARQLQGLHLDESERAQAWKRFGGSLFLGRVFRDLRVLDESVPPNNDVLDQIFASARAKFPDQSKFVTFLRLLAVLGLYERPVPLSTLQTRIEDARVVLRAVELYPSLFSFWDEPKPALALGHRSVLGWVRQNSLEVEWVAHDLSERFLDNPKRGDLMAALRWIGLSEHAASLMDRFFSEDGPLSLWRAELARLQDRGLFFQRVALLDAISEPLSMAVAEGAGNLREELAWVYNARGLSLLELGLVSEAAEDFEQAIALFSTLFQQGDLGVLEAMASAHSRRSEAALESNELTTAVESSVKALGLIEERLYSHRPDPGLSELHSRVLLQSARSHLACGAYEEVLSLLSEAMEALEQIKPERARRLRGECFLVAGQALSGQGFDIRALEQFSTALELLMAGSTAELGLQALIKRGRLFQKLGRLPEAEKDYQRALSIIRFQIALGRLDLEPLLAYTAAQSSLVGADRSFGGHGLSEYISWAGKRIRHEGRSDLRGLLAFLLLTRGARWKEIGHFNQAASDLRRATEQYDLLSREVAQDRDDPVWSALKQSFRNLTALYLSLDEPHLALICGRRALDIGRRHSQESSEELELPISSVPGASAGADTLSEVRLFQVGKLYFHLGEAARRVGLKTDGRVYFERSARAFSQACGSFQEVPEALLVEYALVLKSAAQSAFSDNDMEELGRWVEQLADLAPSQLTDFDIYRFKRWAGYTAQHRGDLKESLRFFEDALEMVKHLREHPRQRSLESEALLDLGRVLSLQGNHDEALAKLEAAARKANDSVFAEGEENRELLILCALHSAVAQLRAGRVGQALDQLRTLISLRPGTPHEVESLADDWVKAWSSVNSPLGMELLKTLGQLSELGDWLLRTSLGQWYRELAISLVNDPQFDSMIMSSSRIDRILETYLILTFGKPDRDTRPESNPELEKLLAAKYRAFESENRDLEAELLMGHLLPIRLDPDSARLLLRRSEMALMRGDRGLAIIDLLRAIDGGGETRLRAHLRLAEFLQSRGLQAAAVHHLLRAMQAISGQTEGLSSLCGRCCRLVTRLAKDGAMLELDFFREHFRLLNTLRDDHLKPVLDLTWLRPAREQKDWSELLELTLDVLSGWQAGGHDKPADWAFLEELLDRSVLCQGRPPLPLMEKLGKLLTQALSTYDPQSRGRASTIWERFASFLPGIGKRSALGLLQRLFDHALRTDIASPDGQGNEFLRRLEEEKRILVQPR